jgi:hypothetical protein
MENHNKKTILEPQSWNSTSGALTRENEDNKRKKE